MKLVASTPRALNRIRVLLLLTWIFAACASAPSPVPIHTYAVTWQVTIENTTIDGKPADFEVDSIDWNPNDQKIALGTSLGIYLYSLETDGLEHIRPFSGINTIVRWNNSGDRLAGNERQLWVWDSSAGTFTLSLNEPDSYEYFDTPKWALDGQTIVSNHFSMTSDERQIWIWDLPGNELGRFVVPDLDNTVVLARNPDSTLFAVATDNVPGIQIVDSRNTDIVQSLTVAQSPVSWSPDGRLLLTRDKDGAIIVWNTSSWQNITTLPGPGDTVWRNVRWHPGGHYVAIATDNGVGIWNLDSGGRAIVQTEVAYDVDWNSDGSQLATAIYNQLYIWNTDQLP
jgi:WD40 repeat protein